MALLRFLKKKEEGARALPTMGMLKTSSVTQSQLREANKAVLQAQDHKENRKNRRGKYNQYTPEQRASIGKYAAQNGGTRAASHFSALLNISVSHGGLFVVLLIQFACTLD